MNKQLAHFSCFVYLLIYEAVFSIFFVCKVYFSYCITIYTSRCYCCAMLRKLESMVKVIASC